jgi:hypothetical protein
VPRGRRSGEQQEQDEAEREVEALSDLGTGAFASSPRTTRPLTLPSPRRGGEGNGGEGGAAQVLTVGQVLSIQV